MTRPCHIALLALLLCTLPFCKNKKKAANTATPAASQPAAATANAPAVGLNLGNAAPEIAMNTPNGTVLTLSSLKGKIVLVDFWASWCGPCRFENPTVVKAYKLYKNKKLKGADGFTVYSVSLDMDANAWKKAIDKDSLVWQQHVSDLKGWNNEAAARYAVTGIPTNFLLNEKGIIIDKNLRGESLLNALRKLETQ